MYIDEFSSVVMPRSGAVQGVVNLDFPGIQDYETLGIFFGKKKKKKKI
jgi:glycosylphosphatidylinositol transamidase